METKICSAPRVEQEVEDLAAVAAAPAAEAAIGFRDAGKTENSPSACSLPWANQRVTHYPCGGISEQATPPLYPEERGQILKAAGDFFQ